MRGKEHIEISDIDQDAFPLSLEPPHNWDVLVLLVKKCGRIYFIFEASIGVTFPSIARIPLQPRIDEI
jgi:hypothetical protein